MADGTTTIPEGLELHKNGTITIHLDNDRARLRRPKIGELRRLRESMWELSDELSVASRGRQDRLDDLNDQLRKLDDDDRAEARALGRQIQDEARKLGRESTRETETRCLQWAADMIGTLSDTTVDPDDLPPWCGTTVFAAELMGHWTSVPTRRGER